MPMKPLRLSILLLMCLPAPPLSAHAQDTISAPPQHDAGRPRGFFDYALSKVNPENKDYGSSLRIGREAAVANTIDDLYFWSNALTLLLLCGSAAVILLQLRSAEKKEVIASSLIAELWNGRVSDRIELERRTAQFNELVETHNAEVERALTLKAQSTEQAKEAAGNLTRSVQSLTGKGTTPGNKGASTGVSSASARSPKTPRGPFSDSLEENLLLQRQLEATRNSEQNLKQRLNQTTLLLDQERRRNGALKGA